MQGGVGEWLGWFKLVQGVLVWKGTDYLDFVIGHLNWYKLFKNKFEAAIEPGILTQN